MIDKRNFVSVLFRWMTDLVLERERERERGFFALYLFPFSSDVLQRLLRVIGEDFLCKLKFDLEIY